MSISSYLLALNLPLLGAAASLYVLLIMWISRSKLMKSYGITTWGPVIIIRTTRGIDLLDSLSRPKRLWRFLASAGVPLVVISMAYFLALVLLMGFLVARSPPAPSSYNAPRNILLIPGINEYIPLVWGWIAIFVTMVVHEFSHGILSRVEGVRVKSMGLAFLIAPIAAFVEPDDEELFGNGNKAPVASRGARIRILSAGVISNFIVAAITMALFFGPVIGAIAPMDRVVVADVQNGSAGALAGFEKSMVIEDVNSRNVTNLAELYSSLDKGSVDLKVAYGSGKENNLALQGKPVKGIMLASIFEDSPASIAGMSARDVITSINGVPTENLTSFRNYMNTTHPGQNITIATGGGRIYKLTLSEKSDGTSLIGIGISGNAVYVSGVAFQEFPAKQFLGVLKAIPVSGLQGFAFLLSLPFTGIPGFTEKGFPGFSGWITNLFTPIGWAAPLGPRFFWIANLLMWVGWINLYAGLFNCLPAVPLDGGHIFKDMVQGSFERFVSVKRAEKLTKTVVAVLAWLVLTSIIITVVAPFTHGISI